jgi:hypothetical protein
MGPVVAALSGMRAVSSMGLCSGTPFRPRLA